MEFLALVLGCALACAAPGPAEQSPAELPVSIERIQKRLQRPAALQMPSERRGDFRAEVTEVFTTPETGLEALRRELSRDVTSKRIAPGTIAPPLISVDLLQIATLVKRQLSGALRARAERNARSTVEAVLREFCAQHDCSVLEQSLPRRSDSEVVEPSHPEGVLTH
jgi:hypothetical protein